MSDRRLARDWNREIVDTLGLQGQAITDLHISFSVHELPRIVISRYAEDDEMIGLIDFLKRKTAEALEQ